MSALEQVERLLGAEGASRRARIAELSKIKDVAIKTPTYRTAEEQVAALLGNSHPSPEQVSAATKAAAAAASSSTSSGQNVDRMFSSTSQKLKSLSSVPL